MWIEKTAYGKLGKYMVNEETGEELYFPVVYKSSYGKRRVKRENSDRFQFFDERTGELSDEFVFANSYRDGFALVLNNYDDNYKFRDLNGNLSEGFIEARNYSNGYAVIRKIRNKYYQYRDIHGNLSEEFVLAVSYENGFGMVLNKKGLWQFRDLAGNLSDEYLKVTKYTKNGFAKVKIDKATPPQWRDMLGNFSKVQTLFGRDLADYIFERKSVFQLCDECFSSDEFVNIMINKEQANFQHLCEMCEVQDDFDKLYEYATDIADYIKGKASEAYLLKQGVVESFEDVNNNQDIDEQKKLEILEKIAKVF